MKISSVKPPFFACGYMYPASQGTLIRQTELWPNPEWTEEEEMEAAFSLFSNLSHTARAKPRIAAPEKTVEVPAGMTVDSAYVDRMWQWDSEKWSQAIQMIAGKPGQQMNLNPLIAGATEEQLLKMASFYFGKEVVAVRWVYYYNVSSGYDCQRLDFMYRETGAE